MNELLVNLIQQCKNYKIKYNHIGIIESDKLLANY